MKDRKEYLREYMRNKRAKAKAQGITLPSDQWAKDNPEKRAESMRRRREKAKDKGVVLPSDTWAKDNPEKQRAKTARWRAENLEKARRLTRKNQAARRSTPWGKINNRMWPVVHRGVKSGSEGLGKYNKALGYTWLQLRQHLEAQFNSNMNWDNWGSYWELDHIKPVSSYRYESIEDDEFIECWSLANMRPLIKSKNQKKGSKVIEGG